MSRSIVQYVSAWRIGIISASIAAAITLFGWQPTACGDDANDLAHLQEEYFRTFANADYQQAEQAARRCLAIVMRLNPSAAYVNLQRIGSCRNGLGFYEEAIDYSKQSLELARKYRPTDDADRWNVIATVNNALMTLGECYFRLNRHEESIDYLQQAIAWNKTHLQNAIQLAKANLILVGVYRGTGASDKIEDLFRQNLTALEPLAAKEAKPGPAADFIALTLSNWAVVHDEEGRFDLAEAKKRRALALHVRIYGWDHSTTATSAASLAVSYMKHGRTVEAEQLLRAALPAQERQLGIEHPETLNTLGNLALVLEKHWRYDEAEALLRRVLAGMESRFGAEHANVSQVLTLLGSCLTQMRRPDEAEPLFDRALAICRNQLGAIHRDTSMAIFWLAYFKHRQRRHREAAELADQLFDNHLQNPLPSWMIGLLHDMRASRKWDEGEKRAAIEELTKAIESTEAVRWFSAGAERERAAAAESTLEVYERMVEWQAELGDLDATFLAIESMNARTFLDELEMNGADFLAGMSPEDRERARQREQELRIALLQAQGKFSALPERSSEPSPGLVAQRRAAAGELFRAQQSLYEHLSDIRRESSAYRQLMSGDRDHLTLAKVRESLLADDDLMLLYSVGWNNSFVMAIRRGAARLWPLEIDEPSAKALSVEAGPLTEHKLRTLLQAEGVGVLPNLSSTKGAHDPTGALAALWRVLIPENEREALTQGRAALLTILPDGPLALLPFETLVVAGDSNPRYLLDAGPPIAYAPSASVLFHLAKRESAAAAKEPVLTLGDPAYATADSAARPAGAARLSRLPFSGTEASWVKQLFDKAEMPAVKLTGAAATEARLRESISGRTILHLACHGAADPNYGNFFGALAVAPGRAGDSRDDGFLSMSEIHELDLRGCELAILSACQTNFGPEQRGEGVWTLSRGFLVAGSRRVIASNWVVDDQAGATLVSYFVREITRGGKDASDRDYATALHEAKRQLRQQKEWAHPFYWSSLVLVGPK